MKNKINILLFIITISLLSSCSSVFTANISGDVKAMIKENATANQETILRGAKVYAFFDLDEYAKAMKTKVIPKLDNTKISTTTTNETGLYSLKTIWKTLNPQFGKTADDKIFKMAVYHKDYGLWFENIEHTLISDSAQNIALVFPFDKRNVNQYYLTLDVLKQDDKTIIPLTQVDPKVTFTITYKDKSIKPLVVEFASIPANNVFTFADEKRFKDNVQLFPIVNVSLTSKRSKGDENYFQVNKEGNKIENQEVIFDTDQTHKADSLYVLNYKTNYSVVLNLKNIDKKDENNNMIAITQVNPKVIIDAYFDNKKVESKEIQDPTNSVSILLERRLEFNKDGSIKKEEFPTLKVKLVSKEDPVNYIQVDKDDKEIESSDVVFNKTISPSTTQDIYLRPLKKRLITFFWVIC